LSWITTKIQVVAGHRYAPSIRKHGCYPAPSTSANDDQITQTLRNMLAMREEQVRFQQKQALDNEDRKEENRQLVARVEKLEQTQVALLREVIPGPPDGIEIPMTTWRIGVEALVEK
jgi:hypothetical protein